MTSRNLYCATVVFIAALVCIYVYITGQPVLWYAVGSGVTLLLTVKPTKRDKRGNKTDET